MSALSATANPGGIDILKRVRISVFCSYRQLTFKKQTLIIKFKLLKLMA